MGSYTKLLAKHINPPHWLEDNVMFEGLTGSVAYAVSNDMSDMDIVGFCIPPKEIVFPHLGGEIPGFGTPKPRFDDFQKHHIKHDQREYDITIYSIVKFFQLVMENNPNMVDALFLPRRCVLHSTQIYEHVRDHRSMFLHKGSWYKFRGYAYSQLSKIRTKSNASNPKRQASIEKYGYDVKFAYHIVRLMLEVEQILAEHDLDLQRNSDILKTIRNGEWTFENIESWFDNKEKSLEMLYANSTLPARPNESKIKSLLMECLEMHYGSLETVIQVSPQMSNLVDELKRLTEKYNR
jgi:predicted nucleotidyltransferase